LLADVEAGLDFVDEDIQFISDDDLVGRLEAIAAQLIHTQATMQDRGDVTTTTVVSLRGEPNAGKSNLLNRLVGRDVAIVADVAGTTRDVVTVQTQIDGHQIKFVDTAGIETLGDDSLGGESIAAAISQRSQQQASRASDEAALRIWCVDSTRPDFDLAVASLQEIAKTRRQSAIDLWVATKSDLATELTLDSHWIGTSSVTGEGIETLKSAILQASVAIDSEETGSIVGTAARCRQTLADANTAVGQAISLTQTQQGHEFVSAELRQAAQCLGEVTGAVYTDDILDRVFSRFCIGK
ncbi:MAG: GTPase, partial [Pirellulaceae bacterium]